MSKQTQEREKPATTPVVPERSNSPIGTILVVDDEAELKEILVEALTRLGFEVTGCGLGNQALAELRTRNFDLLLTDLMMPEMDGISLLQSALKIDPHLVGIVMTGQGTIETAINAMKLGAFDYVLKPFRVQTLQPVLTRAMNVRHLHLENLQLRETVAIHGLCQTIAFTLDPQTVLSKLADSALEQSDADEVSILLPTADGKELYVAMVRGEKRERLLGERVPLDGGISSWVARERVPLILNGEVHDERFVARWPRSDIRSAISVPMQVANRLVGIINLNVTNRSRPFTLGQMKALTILASTAAAALGSASLYAQMRQAEENYRSIFENAVEGVFQSTKTGKFLAVNPAMARILGYDSPEDLMTNITHIPTQIYVDSERGVEAANLQEERGVILGFEFEAYRKDGQKMWVSLNRRTVWDEKGVELYREGSIEDISERKHAEEEQARLSAEIREQRERLKTIVDTVPGVVFEAWGRPDRDSTVDFVSDFAEPMLGYSVAEWSATPGFWLSIVHPDDKERVGKELAMQFAERKVGAMEFRWIGKDGRIVWVRAHTVVIFDQAGTAAGVRGVVTDITGRKQMEDALRESEEQLRQSQKMEAVGRLAGGVAHDFNNLLTAINGYSSLALQRLDGDHPIRSYLEEIKKAGDRAANLTRQLLAFGRKQILQPLALNLNDTVVDMSKMLQRLIGEDVELITKLDPGLSRIKADPGQIEQVLVNLVVNAKDAMPQGGKLTIETRNVTIDQEYADKHADPEPGRYILLAVSDTGTGMDDETERHIFEPFFTTKEKGKGTGLGLSTVYGIVKQSGGNVWVYSELGHGTTFKIYLPQFEAGPAKTEVASVEAPAIGGTETILLVEDEDVVRALASQILQQAGYKVMAAGRGDEAIRMSSEYASEIHLLLTDVVMPETSGKEVAKSVSSTRPGVRVLFMSGYTDEAIVHHGVLDKDVEFIQKPFAPAALVKKVRAVLDANGRPHP